MQNMEAKCKLNDIQTNFQIFEKYSTAKRM